MQIVVTPNKTRKTLEALGRITTKGLILQDSLTPEEVSAISELYPKWKEGLEVTIDEVFEYQQKLYRCVQNHTTQTGWEPNQTPALWTEVAAAGVTAAWVQPTGTQDAYAIGDRVTHDNPNDAGNIWVYESSIDANTTEPGRDGTFDRYWTPIEAI